VAHELNNPLSVVVGRAIMLEEDAPDPETVAAVGKIRQAAERCTRIIKTFLVMARQQPPERVPVHLNELINAALDLVSYGLRTAGITVRLDLAPDLPTLLADAAQLQQVFSNLFVNAQQALLEVPEPRWLHVATRWEHQGHRVCMTVTDNGRGYQRLSVRAFSIPSSRRNRWAVVYLIAPMADSVGSIGNASPLHASSVILGYNDSPAMFQSDVAAGTFVLQLFQAEVRMTSSPPALRGSGRAAKPLRTRGKSASAARGFRTYGITIARGNPVTSTAHCAR
jgi:hypothetical protein